MGKGIRYTVLVLLLLAFTGCSNPPVKLEIGESQRFSEEEIRSAARLVTDSFSFPSAELTKVSYDEETSEKLAAGYISHGKGQQNGARFENVLVLLSEFQVDDSGDNPVLNPGSTYTDFQWILVRESETGAWVIDDWGY